MSYANMEEIVEAVEADANLTIVRLGELREALGYSRLGSNVLREIADELKKANLGYFPQWRLDENDQPRQHDEVRVYKTRSALGDLIDAVLEPSAKNDERLRAAGGNDAEILSQIRKLLA